MAFLNAVAIFIGVMLMIWEAAQLFGTPVVLLGVTFFEGAFIWTAVNTKLVRLFMRSQ